MAELAVVHEEKVGLPALEFTREQVDLIKKTVAKNTTDDELALFLYTAKARGLNPLLRQIHCVKRKSYNSETKSYEDTMAIQTGIDGYRVIAERSGEYDGQDEPIFVYASGNPKRPVSVTVKVYRKDCSRAFVGIAHWDEYCQTTKDGTPTRQWGHMPHVMLSKCAESLALRKAFPEDLAGIYTDDEMSQADSEMRNITPHFSPEADMSTDAQQRAIHTAAKKNGVDVEALLKERFKVKSTKELTKQQASELIGELSGKDAKKTEPAEANRKEINDVYHHAQEVGFADDKILSLLNEATGLVNTKQGMTSTQLLKWQVAIDKAAEEDVSGAIDAEFENLDK